MGGDRDTMALLDQSSRPPFSKAEGEGSRESSPRTVPSMSKNESKKQIFLSGCGKDRSFVEQVYEDLRNEGYRPFFDLSADSLPIGAWYPELILQSARECDIAVVVLSEEYLLSKYPMLELAAFFNAQKLDNKIILPLFYRIEVSALKDVETQRRLFHTWETYAKEDARVDPGKWLDAVTALLNINGLVFNKVSEDAYRKEIVRSINNLCLSDVEFDLSGESPTRIVSGESPTRIVPSVRSERRVFNQNGIAVVLGIAVIISCFILTSLVLLWTDYIPIKGILIGASMEILMLIQSFGSYIPFIGLLLLVTSSIWIYDPSGHKVQVIWKYNFWRFLGMVFKSSNPKLLKFADFVRKIFPHLAPCNALQDDVSWSATTALFMTSTDGGGKLGLGNSDLIVALNDHFEETFSNCQRFQIGAGSVLVTKLTEDQFHFESEVRGEVLEDIVAITNWERIVIVLRILHIWGTSPSKIGVIENLIHREEGIYCHALSIKEILEGVHKSLDYFSVFKLQEAKQFFVGCGGGVVSVSHDKADGASDRYKILPAITAVMVAYGTYFQLRDTYIDAAIASVVVLSALAILILVLDFFGHLFTKGCFYGICTILCCGSTRGRLGIYRWLKKRNSSLVYCDEFKPDQLQLDDHSREAIVLSASNYVRRQNVAVWQNPNWEELGIIQLNWGELYLAADATPLNRPLGDKTVSFSLYVDPWNQVVFRMEKAGRTVCATSRYHNPQATSSIDDMSTEVSVDEHAVLYKWTVGSFHLFVYLMLKWQATDFGVINGFEHYMFRTYYHVFSPHGLASHIEVHKLHSYYLLGRDNVDHELQP